MSSFVCTGSCDCLIRSEYVCRCFGGQAHLWWSHVTEYSRLCSCLRKVNILRNELSKTNAPTSNPSSAKLSIVSIVLYMFCACDKDVSWNNWVSVKLVYSSTWTLEKVYHGHHTALKFPVWAFVVMLLMVNVPVSDNVISLYCLYSYLGLREESVQ